MMIAAEMLAHQIELRQPVVVALQEVPDQEETPYKDFAETVKTEVTERNCNVLEAGDLLLAVRSDRYLQSANLQSGLQDRGV